MNRILLVDDDEVILSSLSSLLHSVGFEVASAGNVPEALRLILSNHYDVLLSDLHMPAPGDGLTVISAMRSAHPGAVTLLLSSFPEMDVAAQSIVRQADEILIKPMSVAKLVETINDRLARGPRPAPVIQSVAMVLEDSIPDEIASWFELVEKDQGITSILLLHEQRTGDLPELLADLVRRLRSPSLLDGKAPPSEAACRHGVIRRHQGYTIPMVVEEFRLLQVCVFDTLQRNLACLDFSCLLLDVMVIADEVDSQMRQALEAYLVPSPSAVDRTDRILTPKAEGSCSV